MIEYGTTGAIGDGKLRLKCMALLLGRLNVSTSFFFCFNMEVSLSFRLTLLSFYVSLQWVETSFSCQTALTDKPAN